MMFVFRLVKVCKNRGFQVFFGDFEVRSTLGLQKEMSLKDRNDLD